MSIYFVQAEHGGPIKIGYTLTNAQARCAALQGGNPSRLVVRHVIDGGPAVEGDLHRRFATSRLVGEWFEPTAELAELAHALPVDGDFLRAERAEREAARLREALTRMLTALAWHRDNLPSGDWRPIDTYLHLEVTGILGLRSARYTADHAQTFAA